MSSPCALIGMQSGTHTYFTTNTKKSRKLEKVYCTWYTDNIKCYKIEYLVLKNGKAPITEWLNSLDSITRKRIIQRILRLEDGNFGDAKKISKDISELRYNFGKGYRIYYTETNETIVLLINGGDKSEQSNDIKKAHKLLNEWRSNNE